MSESTRTKNVGDRIVRYFDIRKPKYRELLSESPEIIVVPNFDSKKRFRPADGERVLLRLEGINLDLKIGGLLKKKKDREAHYGEQTVISGAGYKNAWNIVFTDERILGYLRMTKAGSGAIATPVYALTGRNTMITVQLPLHWIESIVYSKRLQVLSSELRPVELKITFDTAWGKYYLSINGKGLRRFEKTGSIDEQLEEFKGHVANNKRSIIQFLNDLGSMTSDEWNSLEADYSEEYYREPELDENYLDVYIARKYSFTPFLSDDPLYYSDLVNGHTKAKVEEHE